MRKILIPLILGFAFFLCSTVLAGQLEREPYVDKTWHLVQDQNLVESTSVQYSTVTSTVTAASVEVAWSKTFGEGEEGDLDELWINLVFEIKASTSNTADVEVKVQGKNEDYDTWQDLSGWFDYPNIGTSYVQKTVEGYAKLDSLSGKLDRVPFQLQVLVKCDEDNEGRFRLVGSRNSYVRAVYYRSYQ